MNIIFKGNTLTLNQKSPLGAGGEAVVLKYRNYAFKIYHTPSPERTKKLKAFLDGNFSLPSNVACPLEIIQDTNHNVIGFAMNAAKDCKDFMKLSNRKFRYNEQITTNDIIKAFIHAKETLDTIHSQDIIVGDLNDLNILFTTEFLSVFIDVDSYQFNEFPCPVGTEIFIDPELFGINLSEKPYFSRETDWYAFAVMLFKSLLFVYPYGGIHKSVKNMYERIQNKITVFDKDVIYPKVGLPPETISDDLLEYFEAIFKKGKRYDLQVTDILKYKGHFIPCPKCGLFFYDGRKKCPACFKVTPQTSVDLSGIILKKQLDKEVCSMTELFTSEGIILFAKILPRQIIVVDYNYKQTLIHIINSNTHKKIKLWDNHIKGISFDFFDNYLIAASGNDLMIFSFQENTSIPLVKTTTLCYEGEPIMATSVNSMYRLTSTDLMKSHIENKEIIESPILSVMEDQTWLTISPEDTGLGFFRIFEKYHYFVFSDRGRYELNLKPLEGRTIEHEVLFSKKTICLLRKSIFSGRTYSHLDMVDLTGSILYQRSEPSLSSDVLKNINGKALTGEYLIHPTDAGVVVEKAGSLSLKSQTQEYVSSHTQLYLYKDGIATVNDRQILFLKMG